MMNRFVAGLVLLGAFLAVVDSKAVERGIKILNESGGRVEIYWVNPDTRETSLMSTPNVMNGANFPLNSFVGHEFEVREVPAASTGICKSEDKICRTNYFTVSENDDQIITINEGLEIDFVDDQIRATRQAGELVELCQEEAKTRLQNANGDAAETMLAMDDLVACVKEGVTESLAKSNEEIAFQAKIRKSIAAQMENYTCADLEAVTTESISTEVWKGARDKKGRKVHVLFNRPSAKIHLIENFIDPAECKAMEEAAKKDLHRATVADGKGGSEYSESRRAMQAGIVVPWEEEAKGNAIARLSRKVYDYTNHVLDLDIEEFGQEDLMSIQYFGRGKNDTTPDRYTPHCDGDCDGLPHKEGTRMATMVLYCDVPETGGHTNFRNAGVHVKPKSGNGIFFSYIDPDTLVMDTGFTEHSGCPVYEGEKKIVTQWIRLGVDSENPWDSFNTLGLKKGEVDE